MWIWRVAPDPLSVSPMIQRTVSPAATGPAPTSCSPFARRPKSFKWVIAFGEWIFGPTSSWGWRFSVAVLGTLSAVVSGQLDFVPPDVTVWVVRILVWVSVVALGGQAAYRLLHDPAKAIEGATTPRRALDD